MLTIPLFARYKAVPFIPLPTSSCLLLVDFTSFMSTCIQARRRIAGVLPPHIVAFLNHVRSPASRLGSWSQSMPVRLWYYESNRFVSSKKESDNVSSSVLNIMK